MVAGATANSMMWGWWRIGIVTRPDPISHIVAIFAGTWLHPWKVLPGWRLSSGRTRRSLGPGCLRLVVGVTCTWDGAYWHCLSDGWGRRARQGGFAWDIHRGRFRGHG